jgi:hypothetical protein
VRYRLGPRPGIAPAISWNPRTTLPTFLTFEPVLLAAAAAELRIERWLYADSDNTALEACQANWRPAIRELAAAGSQEVPSVAESLAAFNRHILPMERAPGTRGKYLTHRRTILAWAVWKGVLPHLLPMSDDLLQAFLWDALAFEASLPVLRQAIYAVLAWHDRLHLEPPLSGKRASHPQPFPLPGRAAPDLLPHLCRRGQTPAIPQATGSPGLSGVAGWVRHLHAPPHHPAQAAQLSGRRRLNGHLFSMRRGGRSAGLRPLAAVRQTARRDFTVRSIVIAAVAAS